jgi:hypothetical protein
MPLEGHYARQNTPLRALGRPEKRLVAWLGGGLALACVIALAIVVFAGGSAHPAKGCIDATVASTTGGASARACGDAAVNLCKSAAASSAAADAGVRQACRRAGLRD